MKCRNCQSEKLFPLLDLGIQPMAHRFIDKPDPVPAHLLKIDCCEDCGLGQIVNPIDTSELYSDDFNFGFTGWKTEPHLNDELAIIAPYKKVIEIASNDGTFLKHMERNGHTCIGIEPNAVQAKMSRESGFEIYQDFISESLCAEIVNRHGRFDCVVARQVLEHLPNIGQFMRCADILLKPEGRLFVSVPDISESVFLGDASIAWDEHVNYFTPEVLVNVLDGHGFAATTTRRFNFSGGSVCALAKRSPETHEKCPVDLEHHYTFNARAFDYGNRLRDVIGRAMTKGWFILPYGIGCRSTAIINGFRLTDYITLAVDDQKEKQGKYMSNGIVPIIGTDEMFRLKNPTLVLLGVNQENEAKVKARLATNKNLYCMSILGPTNIHAELTEFENHLADSK